ncbi:MAG: hypothetical protein FWC79_07270 [Oscillospiraceae bacterium]|nr:hypothetical protein [Oscillospiraceae bacterium]
MNEDFEIGKEFNAEENLVEASEKPQGIEINNFGQEEGAKVAEKRNNPFPLVAIIITLGFMLILLLVIIVILVVGDTEEQEETQTATRNNIVQEVEEYYEDTMDDIDEYVEEVNNQLDLDVIWELILEEMLRR